MLLVNLFLACLAIGLGAEKEMVAHDNWLFDTGNNIEISGSRLTALELHGLVFNALYLGIVANETNKRFYWEFHCVQGCHSVGVTKKVDNYDLTQRITGGHIFDNSYQESPHLSPFPYVPKFGELIKDGDRIGFILDAGEQELKIYLVQNDRPLGLAFIQKAPYSSELYPAVIFYNIEDDVYTTPRIIEINEKKNISTDHLLVRADYPEKGERSTILAIQKGIRGDYKLVKVNETVRDCESYFLRLSKLELSIDEQELIGNTSIIRTVLLFGDSDVLNGHIWEVGKDAEGDLYKFIEDNWTWLNLGPLRVMGRMSKDTKRILTSIKNLKRIKFGDFEELSIISTNPNSTLIFKRFVHEEPAKETSELAA